LRLNLLAVDEVRTGQVPEKRELDERSRRWFAEETPSLTPSPGSDTTVARGGFVAAEHLHPYQCERFEIVCGEVEFKLGKEISVAKPGDVLMVEPSVPHRFRNVGEEEIRFLTEVRPALSFETFLQTMFGLASDGKTNEKGLPNPLRLAVIMNEQFNLVRLPFAPAWVQRLALALGAPLGLLFGYEPTYVPDVWIRAGG
jgi:mannose-6-phosphate isomerase-like protein (cupin superfamily)